MVTSQTLAVSAIRNGTVIDHISAGQALRILRMLDLSRHQKVLSLGINLPSQSMGAKDIIKIEERELSPEEVNQVAILSPSATVSVIKDNKVVKKFKVTFPDHLAEVIVCPNRRCITNHEGIKTLFSVQQVQSGVRLECHHCRHQFPREEIQQYTV